MRIIGPILGVLGILLIFGLVAGIAYSAGLAAAGVVVAPGVTPTVVPAVGYAWYGGPVVRVRPRPRLPVRRVPRHRPGPGRVRHRATLGWRRLGARLRLRRPARPWRLGPRPRRRRDGRLGRSPRSLDPGSSRGVAYRRSRRRHGYGRTDPADRPDRPVRDDAARGLSPTTRPESSLEPPSGSSPFLAPGSSLDPGASHRLRAPYDGHDEDDPRRRRRAKDRGARPGLPRARGLRGPDRRRRPGGAEPRSARRPTRSRRPRPRPARGSTASTSPGRSGATRDSRSSMLTARDDELDKLLGPRARRRRLPDEAVQPARARRPGQGRPAPGRCGADRAPATSIRAGDARRSTCRGCGPTSPAGRSS